MAVLRRLLDALRRHNVAVALIGLVVLGVSLYFSFMVKQVRPYRAMRTRSLTSPSGTSGIIALSLLPQCRIHNVTSTVGTPVLNESFSLRVAVQNPADVPCASQLEVYGSGFAVARDAKNVKVAPKNTSTVSFELLPKVMGHQQVTVSRDDSVQEIPKEFTVYPMRHVPPFVYRIATHIPTALGGMLTVPWWIERFSRKGKKTGRKPKTKKAQTAA